MSATEPKRLNLTIRLTSGRKFQPNAPPAGITTDTTVAVFKSLLAATMIKRSRDATASAGSGGDADAGVPMEPIPASRQRLVYKGRIMSDATKTLGEYGVEDGGMIYLVKGNAPASGDGGSGGGSAAAAAPVGPSPMARLQAANASAAGAPPLNPFAAPGAGGQGQANPMASLMQMQSMFGGAGGTGGGGMPDVAQMQEQLRNNPEMMSEMMNNPMIQSLMDNPQFM